MKKIIAFFLVLILCLPLFGCSALRISPLDFSPGERYQLIEENGQYYLYFPALQYIPPKGSAIVDYEWYIYFDSPDEMRDDILQDGFTSDEISRMLTSANNKNLRFKICDPYHLYEPVYPDCFQRYVIRWRGYSYDLQFPNDIPGLYARMCIWSKDYYETVISESKLDKMKNDWENKVISFTEDPETGERDLVVYRGNWRDTIHMTEYTLTNENRTLHICESYVINGETETLKSIDIYGCEQDAYFWVEIYNDKSADVTFTRDELLEFGIHPYS